MSDIPGPDTSPLPEQNRPALSLALADQARCWRAGTPVSVETYLEREPALQNDPEAILDLIYKEVLLRTERNEKPERDEYARRFPELAGALGPIFEIHQALESNSELMPTSLQMEQTLRSQPSGPPPPPPEVPGYEMLERLGQGGMGVVYKARQKRLDRTVALKMVLAGAHANHEDLARFSREAEVVAKLAHPNIVQIHEVGEHDGRPFLSLEFIEGGGLDKKLGGAPQPARESALLVETLARAVHHAHIQGVIHRDLKPANVLLTLNGTPKVTDFGLARSGAGSGQTQSGDVLGTPSYMAPEQAAGKISAIGPATDVYALGAILYELLTGRPPFRAQNAIETLLQVMEQEPVPPTRLQASVPHDLETICLKCLQKSPPKRYDSAEALADDLRRFLDGHPILARPTSTWERTLKWARRRPALAALYTVSAAAVVAVLLYNVWLQAALSDANHQRSAAQKALEERRRQLVQVLQADGTRLLDEGDWFGSLLPFAQAYWLDQENADRAAIHQTRLASILRQCPRLAQFWPQSVDVSHTEFTPDGSRAITVAGNAVRFRDVVTGEEAEVPLVHDKAIKLTALRPDGRRLATATEDNSVHVWDLATSQRVGAPIAFKDAVAALAFKGDSERIVAATRETSGNVHIQIWDATEAKAESPPVVVPSTMMSEVAISPDGRLAATAELVFQQNVGTGVLTVWEVVNARKVFEAGNLPSAITKIQFSPDSRRVTAAIVDGTARVWNSATGKQSSFVRHGASILHLAFSPDSRRFATSGVDGTAYIWDCEISKGLGTLKHGRAFTHAVHFVAFAPDGIHAVTAGADNTARVWNLTTDSAVGPPLRHTDKLTRALFSPDGRHVMTTSRDKTVRLWDLASSRLAAAPLEHDDNVNHANFNSSGSLVVTAGDDRLARVWDLASGRPQGSPFLHTHRVVFAGFDSEGHVLSTAEHDPAGEGEACAWEAAKGTLLFRRETSQRIMAPDADRTVRRAWFSHDGRLLLAMDGVGKAQVWDVRAGRPSTGVLAHRSAVTGAAFSADGRYVLTETFLPAFSARALDAAGQATDALKNFYLKLLQLEKTVNVWGTSGEKKITSIGPWSDSDAVAFRFAAFSPSSAAEGGSIIICDGQTSLWDVDQARAIRHFRKPGSATIAATLSPNGRILATTSDDETAQLWDANTGELAPMQLVPAPVNFWYAGQSWPPVFSPDGRLLVLGGENGIRVWEVASGFPVAPTLGHPGKVKSAALSSDGRFLLTACDRAARVWALTADGRSAADWLRLAQFLSCSRIHPQAGLPVLPGLNEPLTAWEELRRKSPKDFQITEGDVTTWHAEAARACEKIGKWQAALFHLEILATRHPQRPELHDRKGRARAEMGLWTEAAADFEKATALGADLPGPWHRHALLRLHLGDSNGYRRVCADMLDRFGSAKHAASAQLTVWTCVLAPLTQSDGVRLAPIAERALVDGPKNHSRLLLLGAALYRAGRFQDAVNKLSESIKVAPKEEAVWDWLFLAMAHQALGQADLAKNHLDLATRYLDQANAKVLGGAPIDAPGGAQPSWANPLEIALLRREAETVVKKQAP
ncbi:MAG: protein kinase [Planctomycetes bacterium]|nr:protein kinase [Planctomycetota bacterium]